MKTRSCRNNLNLKSVLVLAAAAISIGATQALAQGRYAIEEITVSARKIEEGLQNAPIAVSAFTSQDLENRGAVDVTDIALAAPNVHFQTGGATSGMSAAPTVFIRGIGQSDFNINNDPAVGMYVDGVYMGRMIGSLTDLMDLERAEVLRGPQGTLFGRNSIGGAINLISKKPDPTTTEGSLSVSLGEQDFAFVKGSANIPLSDIAAVRVSGLYREREGHVDAVEYQDLQLGGEEVWGGRVALRVEPTESFSADLAVDYSERRDPPAAIVPLQLGNVSANPGSGDVAGDDRSTFPSAFRFNTGLAHYGGAPIPPPPADYISQNTALCSDPDLVDTSPLCFGNYYVDGDSHSVWVDREGNVITPVQALDQEGASLVLNWDLDFGTLTSTTAYREMEASFTNDGDLIPFVIFHNLNDQFVQDQLSQEIQLAGSFSDNLSYITGLYYFEESGTQTISLVSPLLPPAGAPPAAATLPFFQRIDRDIDNESKAIFGQVIYDFSDHLHLTVGARHTENEKSIDLGLIRGDENAPWFSVDRDDEISITETNVLVNLSWDATDNTMVYVQYADGFRDGGWPVRFPGLPAGIPELDTVAFEPEYVSSIELGVKSDLLDGDLRVNAAIFSSDYEDMQISFSDPLLNGAPNTSNVGEATIQGLEVELNYLLTDSLRLDISGGYLDASLDSVFGGSLTSGGDNTATVITTANELPYTPELQLSLGVNYGIDLSSGAFINSRIDWVYTDDQYFTIENSDLNFQDAYSVINAKMSYESAGGQWLFALGARNLADEEYSTAGRTQSDTGSAFNNIARPREAYLEAVYRFGE